MHEDDGGAERESLAAPLLEPVAPPGDTADGRGEGAPSGLVHERDAVREAQALPGPVRRQVAADKYLVV